MHVDSLWSVLRSRQLSAFSFQELQEDSVFLIT
jgi:hypothetical protein